MRQAELFVFILSSLLFQLKAQPITISNLLPRKDVNGRIIDAHDGNMLQLAGRFYWYGTAYGNTNGYLTANFFQCFSSTDLKNWKPEGNLLPGAPAGVYYRPHVVYNKRRKKYVLWYNWYPSLWDGKIAVAESDTPGGPFRIVDKDVKVANSSMGGLGDLTLFVDEDQTCYISYTTISGHKVSIEKLNDDYLSSSLANSGVIAEDCEASILFRRQDKYYLLTDQACCFCNFGSGNRVYISGDPLRGYQLTGNINRYPGRWSPLLIDGMKRANLSEKLSKSGDHFDGVQLELATQKVIDKITVTVFTGNRPENCGNATIPRVHPEFIVPEFDLYINNGSAWTKIEKLKYSIDSMATCVVIAYTPDRIYTDKIRVVPRTGYLPDNIYLSEVEVFSGHQNLALSSNGGKAYVLDQEKPPPIIPAQGSWVTEIKTKTGRVFIWAGDLWGSASDNEKGHDYQYWQPLRFDSRGNILPLQWNDDFKIAL